ncbi:MAG: molybdopterin-dependent oxidoreductase [Pirellulales bacterium]|nr:molybdopterin-dependent oxidoreductase [Pirellulales bacterium]
MSKLPANQQLVAANKWPITGEKTPRKDDRPWSLTISGEVAHAQQFSLDDLLAMPQREFVVDIHCVTRWSKLGAKFSGILVKDLLEFVRPNTAAGFVSFVARSERDHSTSLPLADTLELGAFVALHYEGKPLATDHGGPMRIVTPGRYFYKSLKWLEKIELLAEDRLGYWEADVGYHNTADPWREQRYIAPNLSRQETRTLIESRDFSGRDLRSIEASRRELRGLNAVGAQLRDADFRECDLRDADFREANLSNARLQGADLRGAQLADADLEGANFARCDLRGANFLKSSLFGASFVDLNDDVTVDASTGARIDTTVRFGRQQLTALTPIQEDFIQNSLASAAKTQNE